MSESLPLFLAGLAFFFIGVSNISSSLRQMSGRRLRQFLTKATNRPVSAGVCGFLFGMLTQSSSAVAFILSGMIATGLITLRSALPVLATANVGTSVLVFLAALNIKVAIFWLLAISGLSIAFKWAGKWMPAAGAAFAIGLLFYGLHLMKAAFAPLPDYEGFQQVAAALHTWTYAPFLLGVVMRIAIQSSSAIGVISITLAGGGLFSEFQSMLLICGSGVGVSIAAYLMSGTLKGVAKQIILFQALINVASGLTLASILTLDRWTGQNLLGLMQHNLPQISDRIAVVFLCLMLGCWLYAMATLKWMPKWLEQLCPSTPEQDLSRPEFIHDEALKDPDTAVDLAEREQVRLLELLPRYCDAVRQRSRCESTQGLHHSARSLCNEIEDFLGDLISRQLSGEQSRQALSKKRLLELISQLEENVHSFSVSVREVDWSEGRRELVNNLVESLDTITLTAIDAVKDHDMLDHEMLMKMTEDRGEMMEKIRQNALGESGSIGEQSSMQYATSLFERNVWLFRQIGLWVKTV